MSVPGSVFSMFALLIFLPSGETTYTTTAASAVLFLIKVFRVYIKNRENVKYILNRRVNTVYCKAPEKLAQHIRRNCRIVSPADKKSTMESYDWSMICSETDAFPVSENTIGSFSRRQRLY